MTTFCIVMALVLVIGALLAIDLAHTNFDEEDERNGR